MTTSHLALRGLLVLLAGLPLASLAGEVTWKGSKINHN